MALTGWNASPSTQRRLFLPREAAEAVDSNPLVL